MTKLQGPTKRTCYQLYVIIDVFSRYVTGWLLADPESITFAKRLVHETCRKQKIQQDELTLHADHGNSMKSKPLALLLTDLGVTEIHSHPRVSNDNPNSESQFKKLKYRPDLPERFGSLPNAREDASAWVGPFCDWYNQEHYYSCLGLLTPASVHFGLATEQLERRQRVLNDAFSAYPELFVRKQPSVQPLPEAAWVAPQQVLEVGEEPPFWCLNFSSECLKPIDTFRRRHYTINYYSPIEFELKHFMRQQGTRLKCLRMWGKFSFGLKL